MTISIRDVGRAKIVEVNGDVDLGTSGALHRTLFAALPETSILALNLEAIRYIDSSGIATLIEVLNVSRRLNKQFVLFGLSTAVEEVFGSPMSSGSFGLCKPSRKPWETSDVDRGDWRSGRETGRLPR
jgi:anti-sigma B factor antagonist